MTARWKVLVSAPYLQPVLEAYRCVFERARVEVLVPHVKERLEESELLACIAEVDGVICGDDRFTAKVLQSAPRLRVISKWGTGIDSIDRETCQRLGIRVCNTPNAFSDPVADSVLGYILCFARNLVAMARTMQQGGWQKLPGSALSERTLGVIGVGNVGKAVVRRARAFGMTVVGNDIVEMPPAFLAESSLTMVSKEKLFTSSDFVSIHCDLNPTTHHLVGARELGLMKPGAVLINTARGPIVEERALVEALQAGRLAGAALDVFEVEPLTEDSPLRQMPNVLLAPHNSNSSPAAWTRVHQRTVENLLRGLEEVNR